MTITLERLIRIFDTQGAKAAIVSANINGYHKEAEEIEAGLWAPRRVQVDRHKDKLLLKVTQRGCDDRYEVDTKGEGGSIVTINLGSVPLHEARAAIGKYINPPKPARYGEKTNDPANMCPKGVTNGGKQQVSSNPKEAARRARKEANRKGRKK